MRRQRQSRIAILAVFFGGGVAGACGAQLRAPRVVAYDDAVIASFLDQVLDQLSSDDREECNLARAALAGLHGRVSSRLIEIAMDEKKPAPTGEFVHLFDNMKVGIYERMSHRAQAAFRLLPAFSDPRAERLLVRRVDYRSSGNSVSFKLVPFPGFPVAGALGTLKLNGMAAILDELGKSKWEEGEPTDLAYRLYARLFLDQYGREADSRFGGPANAISMIKSAQDYAKHTKRGMPGAVARFQRLLDAVEDDVKRGPMIISE